MKTYSSPVRDPRMVLTVAVLLGLPWLAQPAVAQQIVATVTLPECGYGVGISADGAQVYVGLRSKLAVVDAHALAVSTVVPLTTENDILNEVVVNTLIGRIFAGGTSIYLVDPPPVAPSWTVVTRIPYAGEDLAVNEQTNVLYAAEDGFYVGEHDWVRIFDGTTGAKLNSLDLGVSSTYQYVYVTANSHTNLAYATYSLDDGLHIISGVTHTQIQRIGFSEVHDVMADPLANRIYMIENYKALVLDGDTHAEVGQIKAISGRLGLNSQRGLLYATRKGLNDWELIVADTDTRAVLARVTLPNGIFRYAVDPASARLYMTTYDRTNLQCLNTLLVVDDSAPHATLTPTRTATPTRTPTVTRTPTRTPTPTFRPLEWLPLILLD